MDGVTHPWRHTTMHTKLSAQTKDELLAALREEI